MPLISVIYIFAMSICRSCFTLLQSSVSRHPCKQPARSWYVPTNGNRERRLRPRPVLWVPPPSKAIPATTRKPRRPYLWKDRCIPRRFYLHGWVPRPPRSVHKTHANLLCVLPLFACPYFLILHSTRGGGFSSCICLCVVYRFWVFLGLLSECLRHAI